MRDLRWYRGIADLTVRNDVEVVGIAPLGRVLAVSTKAASGGTGLLARRRVIATGHAGGGGRRPPRAARACSPGASSSPPGMMAAGSGRYPIWSATGCRHTSTPIQT